MGEKIRETPVRNEGFSRCGQEASQGIIDL
jgi:hypothetical protein